MLGIVSHLTELGSMVMDDAGKAELAQMLTSLGHHLGTFLAVLHGYQMIQRTDVCKLCAELLGQLTVIVIPQAVERKKGELQ